MKTHATRARWADRLVLLVAVIGPAFCALSGAGAEGPSGFEVRTLDVGGKLTDLVTEDFDGDGRTDLLVVSGRDMRLFRQRDGGGYPETPDQHWKLDRRAILFDVGDLEPDGKKEILVLTDEGVSAYRQKDGAFVLRSEPVLSHPSVLRQAVPDEVRKKSFFLDLTGDRIPDLVLPVPEGFRIFRKGSNGFEPFSLLPVQPSARLFMGKPGLQSKIFARFFYPLIHTGELDGDGRMDLFCQDSERLHAFLASGKGPTRSFEVAGVKVPGRLTLELDVTHPLDVEDMTGDGLCDFILTHLGKGMVAIFRGAPDRKEFETPDVVIRVKGLALLSVPIDVNGDGRKDLVLLRSDELGILQILSVLVQRELEIETLTFINTGEPPYFRPEPDDVHAFDLPIAFQTTEKGMKFGALVLLSFFGDHDGDGRRDLVLGQGSDALAFYRGQGSGGFSEEPFATVAIPTLEPYRFIEPRAADLDGDGRDELLLMGYTFEATNDRIVILRPVGGGVR